MMATLMSRRGIQISLTLKGVDVMFKKISTSLVLPSIIFGLSGFGFGAYQMIKPVRQSLPENTEPARPAPAREQAKKDIAAMEPVVAKATEDSYTQIYSYPAFQDLHRNMPTPANFKKVVINAMRNEVISGRITCDQPLATLPPQSFQAITLVKCEGKDGLKVEADLPLAGTGSVTFKTSFGLKLQVDPGI
jgi:hypothetical protein